MDAYGFYCCCTFTFMVWRCGDSQLRVILTLFNGSFVCFRVCNGVHIIIFFARVAKVFENCLCC